MTYHSQVACIKKKQYTSEAESWAVIFRMRAKGQDIERLQPYRCDHCTHWHLGRTPPGAINPAYREVTT